MIWWLVAGKFVKAWFPVIVEQLWKHRDIVLLIVLVAVVLRCCGTGKDVVKRDTPVKELVKEKPVIRYVTRADSLTEAIYDSIFSLFRDSVDIRIVRRDRVEIVKGDTVVVTDSVEIGVPRCWNQYHKLLASHTDVNSYRDTIYVVDTTKRALRRPKRDTTLVLYLTEDVQLNKIKLRKLSYQDFRKVSANKRVRIYGGVMAGGNKGFGQTGVSVLVAGNKIGFGYVYLIKFPHFADSHNALLYYRLSK